MYDGQLDKIEEESEANTDAHDSEIERIELLKEQKIISEEEAQARKRAAEDKTRKKEEELEKDVRISNINRLFGIKLQISPMLA